MFLYRKLNALSKEICKDFIESFENSDRKAIGSVSNNKGEILEKNNIKVSTDIAFLPRDLNDPVWGKLLKPLVNILLKNLENYQLRYSLFHSLPPLTISPLFNIQRYSPGEAFFGYHCERSSLITEDRYLVWMIYLNDITDRGETEFFYQHHFEDAQQGKLIIWPSDWTYLHRGIMSPSQTKYILTGWFVREKQNNE